MAAMAKLCCVPVCEFVRAAVRAQLQAEHDRIFPGVAANPWRLTPEPGDVARHVAEGFAHG